MWISHACISCRLGFRYTRALYLEEIQNREIMAVCYYRYIKRKMAEANEYTCSFGTQLVKKGEYAKGVYV